MAKTTDTNKCIRSVGQINAEFEDIVYKLRNLRSSEHNPWISEFKILKSISNKSRIEYVKEKRVTVAPRDYCLLTTEMKSEFKYILASISCEDEEVPVKTGTIRAQQQVGGWIIRRIPNKNYCDVTYFAQKDYGGQMSEKQMNKFREAEGMRVVHLKNSISEY